MITTPVPVEPEPFYRSMLEDAIRFCNIHSQNCLKLSGDYRGADLAFAHNRFAVFLDQILTFLQFVDQLSAFTHVRLAGRISEEEFIQSLQALTATIQDAAKAQSAEDWVLLADLLEYEFPLIFQGVIDSIDNLWAALEGKDIAQGN